jgi:general secretion pathway protein A
MYTAFYGLREKPFALSPDPRFLFLAESHREALAHLLYGIEQGEGFIVITGEVGTGKTTICRTLLGRLGADTAVAFLFNPKLSALELMQSIHDELGLSGAGASWRELNDELNRFLVAKRHEGKRVLLVIDEAQNLAPDTLEQIRLLSNLETDTSKLIQIVLLGQPELDAKLSEPELRQLRQRITVYWKLVPLSASETADYVRHRLRIAAGIERPLFHPAAEREVRRLSGGIPRLVNVICDRALLAGYAAGVREIGPRLVAQAATELELDTARSRLARLRDALPWLQKRTAGRRWFAAAGILAAVAVGVGLGTVWARSPSSHSTDLAAPAHVDVAAADPASTPNGVATAPPRETPVDATRSAEPPSRVVATEAAASPPAPGIAASSADARDGASTALTEAPAASDPARSSTLAALLSASAPGAITSRAVDAALRAWGEPALGSDALGVADGLAAFTERGFSVLSLSAVQLESLAALGYPAFVVLPTDEGVGRLGWLTAVDGDVVTLDGVGRDAPIRLPASELEAQWTGEAFVVWRDFETLPDVIGVGERGDAVRFVQRSLAELGFTTLSPSGEFDVQTLAAVLAFQHSHSLAPDGSVGPRTKMALYRALQRYPLPHVAGVGTRTSG